MTRLRIAFTGFKGSGKTTASEYLINRHNFKRISFAQPLKDICRDVFGVIKHEEPYKKPINLNDPDKLFTELYQYISNNYNLRYNLRDFFNLYNTFLDIYKEHILPYHKNENVIEHSRKILQKFGTEFFRTLDKNIWVKLAEQNINQYKPDSRLVIDDLRFKNELDILKKYGFYIVGITRPELDINDLHESEQSIKELIKHVDTILLNNDLNKFLISVEEVFHGKL